MRVRVPSSVSRGMGGAPRHPPRGSGNARVHGLSPPQPGRSGVVPEGGGLQDRAWRHAQVGEASWRLWARASAVAERCVDAGERECVVADRMSRSAFCGEDSRDELHQAACRLLCAAGASARASEGAPIMPVDAGVQARLDAWAEAGASSQGGAAGVVASFSSQHFRLNEEELGVLADAAAATLKRGQAGGRAFKAIHNELAAAAFALRSLLGYLYASSPERFVALCRYIDARPG